MKHQTTRSTIFDLHGVPAFNQAFPLALQHVVAMIVGCVTPAIIVSGVAGLSEADSVILIQAALVTSADVYKRQTWVIPKDHKVTKALEEAYKGLYLSLIHI